MRRCVSKKWYANESRDLANDELRGYDYEALPPQPRRYVNEKRFDEITNISSSYALAVRICDTIHLPSIEFAAFRLSAKCNKPTSASCGLNRSANKTSPQHFSSLLSFILRIRATLATRRDKSEGHTYTTINNLI
jgi:hypothetical protein